MKKVALLMAALSWPLLHWQTIQCAYAYPNIEAMDLDDENPDQQEALGRIYDLLDRIDANVDAYVFAPEINPQIAGRTRNKNLTDIEKIRDLLEEGPDALDHVTGHTDFLIAGRFLHSEEKVELIRALTDYHLLFGEDHFFNWINRVSNRGETPLEIIYNYGHNYIDLFALLLLHGASPDQGWVFGGPENTLHYYLTIRNNHWDIPYKNLINQYAPEQPDMDIE